MPPVPVREIRNLTVITTHINADFDALASMLAAQKLYPDAVVVFPGSQEKNLRNFFISSMAYLFNMVDLKDIDLNSIRKLVLVDTRQPGRIGRLAEILDKPGLEIHAYDHHPPAAGDIKAHYEVVRLAGATVTLLTEILKEQKIPISPDEATIMCLGIYEDTGSFTFSSTTESDFIATAHLLSMGANLNTVSNLISREISPQQVGVLNDMIQGTVHYSINGIDVVVTSITNDHYVPDFAFLVHKMIKMENIDVIFAIGLMADKIYIVGRSRISDVDVGDILTPFGGGGHMYAAAATVKGTTLPQVENRLLETLNRKIRPQRLARDLMSSPPLCVGGDVACKEAANLLTRYNINALLVVESPQKRNSLIGYVTRQVIEKALYHNLGELPVKEYMTTELTFAGPDADLPEIQDKIIDSKQRILPIIDNGVILGVVTRTDLLNILIRRSRRSGRDPNGLLKGNVRPRTKTIVNFIHERLSRNVIEILRSIGQAAAQVGYDAYVVGGFVRDLFLYRKNEDLDIVIEGDGIAFAKKYAKTVGARIHTYAKFGTAVIIFPDGFKVDVASARMEYYKFPAALPTVEMSSIKLDLFRRDFTINTLAIQLHPDKFGMLIDFFSAQQDIKEKAIRVLHNLSFVEDPTRVFRAIRFEQRFGFTIGKLTESLIKNAVKMDFFKRLSGRRVFAELRQILEEENPTPAIIRLHDYTLLRVIHPSIKFSTDLITLLNSVDKVLYWNDLLFLKEPYMRWAVYFLALIYPCSTRTTEDICRRLELAPRHQTLFIKNRTLAGRCMIWLERNLPVSNSVLYRHLSGFRIELLLYMMAASKFERMKEAISFYFTQLRGMSIALAGKDLLGMGLKPGPAYREVLQATLDAKLDGALKTKKDEMAFARRYIETMH